MKIEKNRHLIILKTLIENDTVFVTSELLAEKCMSSVRTIKNDIKALDSDLQNEGIAYINSKASKGYQIIPTDNDLYQSLKESVQVHDLVFRRTTIEEMNRRLFILQKMLSNNYVKIDDLCNELYLSRSSLTKDMGWVIRFLKSYHVKAVSVPGKGYRIDGKEQDIRSAMIEVFCSQYHDIEMLYPVDEFADAFETDLYEDIRHEILKVIRESEISISDIATKKIATHLCLINDRRKQGKTIEFNGKESGMIRESYEFLLSKQIMNLPIISRHVAVDETEEVNLARLLMINKDIDLRESTDASHISADLLNEASHIMDDYIQEYGVKYQYSVFISDHFAKYRKDIESIILRILYRNKLDYTDKYRLITYTENRETSFSPVAMEYARLLMQYLEGYFGQSIRGEESRVFAQIFQFILKSIRLDVTGLRLAVFSMEGRTAAELMKEELTEYFSGLISKADVFNLYEMRRIDFSQYDAAISSWDVAYYVYPLPLISYPGTDRKEDRIKLFKELFIHSFSDQAVKDLEQVIKYYPDVKIADYMEMIRIAAKKYSNNKEQMEQMIQKAVRRFSTLSYYNAGSGVSTIFLDYADTGKEILDIYQPEKTVYWGTGLEIRYFLVLCLNPAHSLSDIRIMDAMVQKLSSDSRNLRRLIKSGTDVLRKIYSEVLMAQYL